MSDPIAPNTAMATNTVTTSTATPGNTTIANDAAANGNNTTTNVSAVTNIDSTTNSTPTPTTDITVAPTRRREHLAITTTNTETSASETAPQPEEPLEIIPDTNGDPSPDSNNESEANKELEPEVEKAIDNMQQGRIKAPSEVVVSANTLPAMPPRTMNQPVVVLPLSEKAMQKGQRKDVTHSVRWLYEYCRRQIQKLQEMIVIYRDQ